MLVRTRVFLVFLVCGLERRERVVVRDCVRMRWYWEGAYVCTARYDSFVRRCLVARTERSGMVVLRNRVCLYSAAAHICTESSGVFVPGMMAQLRMYPRALSEDEVCCTADLLRNARY